MEEINLKELYTYFINKIWYIIIITILAGILGFSYVKWIKTPMYESDTLVLLSMSSNSKKDTTITQSEITLNKSLVGTYQNLIVSRTVLNKVITNLDLNITAEQLKKCITVSSDDDAEMLIRITVDYNNAQDAKDIANEISRVFIEEIEVEFNMDNAFIQDEAELNEEPYNVNEPKHIIIFGLVGLVLSCAVIFVLFYFDDTIKNAEEVEQKLGIPVIGLVPEKQYPRKKEVK